jgi:hypothetical protein
MTSTITLEISGMSKPRKATGEAHGGHGADVSELSRVWEFTAAGLRRRCSSGVVASNRLDVLTAAVAGACEELAGALHEALSLAGVEEKLREGGAERQVADALHEALSRAGVEEKLREGGAERQVAAAFGLRQSLKTVSLFAALK